MSEIASSHPSSSDTQPSPWLVSDSMIQIRVQPEITREDIHAVIDRILSLTGCRTCGLVGVDVQFFGGDPAYLLSNLPGVQDVRIVPKAASE